MRWIETVLGAIGYRDGRSLEIREVGDGTFHLMVWKSPASSATVGVFSHIEPAKLAGETMSLDDASIKGSARDPFSPLRFVPGDLGDGGE